MASLEPWGSTAILLESCSLLFSFVVVVVVVVLVVVVVSAFLFFICSLQIRAIVIDLTGRK